MRVLDRQQPVEGSEIVSCQSIISGHRRFGVAAEKLRTRILVIGSLTVAAIIALVLLGPISQNEAYHNFADQHRILGIPNFMNVISNVPFLVSGIWGVLFVARRGAAGSKSFVYSSERWPYLTFFLGVMLTSLGSAYYHFAPSTDRLMWDRLPMSIAFMSLLAAVISERINVRAGLVLLAPLLVIGIGSVVSWHLSERNGNGDLRLYVVVQFYSMLAILLIAAMFQSRYSRSKTLAAALVLYAAAKVLELLDVQIFSLMRIISGHTLKHLTAAMSALLIVHMLKNRGAKQDNLIVDLRDAKRTDGISNQNE